MFNELLNEIREKEIEISFDNGKLNYSGPAKFINDDFLRKLREYKSDLIKYYWPADSYSMMPINPIGNLFFPIK